MSTDCSTQLTFWELGQQVVTVDFQGGTIVSDAGLLPLRWLDKELGVLSTIGARLPDPRAQPFVEYTCETILTQEVYQILAGYPDGNDAQTLRHDPLMQTLADVSPSDNRTLASASTINRFHYAYTRRQAHVPVQERPAVLDRGAAQTQRIQILNDYLPELFMRTRTTTPSYVILDLDATDDPTHGQQVLSFFHGYYEQHQYYPLLVFDGDSSFPLAAWLRPGTVSGSCGAVAVLRSIVQQLRQAWPEVVIVVRGDTAFAVPELYEWCEAEGVLYAFGYGSNGVLKRQTETALSDLETYYWY